MNEIANLAAQDNINNGETVNGLSPLLCANVAALDEGRSLLTRLSDEVYVAPCRPAFRSFIGAHFRHLLEHYQCFLSACDTGQQSISICYDTRPRVSRLEESRSAALETIDQLTEQLSGLNNHYFSDTVCLARDQEALGSVASTLQRELLFLQSHSIHHHAMIAAMCRLHGVDVEEGFGVAIATQVFDLEQRACDEVAAAASLDEVDD